MRAEIIAVGTELLLGQILNSNAQYLAEECAGLGVDIYYQTVVGDNESRIIEVLNTAKGRSEIVFITGGLGPTMDDLTKDALAVFTNRSIVIDEPAMNKIRHIFVSRGLNMVESNIRQAHLIEGSHPLPNDNGLAIGLILSEQNVHYILLPGPPKEMKLMFETYAKPWIKSMMNQQSSLYSKTIKFAGIGESELEHRLKDLIKQQHDPTIAPYAKEGEVSIRLTTKAATKDEAEEKLSKVTQQIQNRLETFIYAYEDISIETVIFRMLQKRKQTLSVAESCTGGLLSHLMTVIAGSSSVFNGGVICYTNLLKHRLMGVPMSLLEGENAPGAVSSEAAHCLAEHIRIQTNSNYGISITGIAGPSSTEGKPVGLVYIGLSVQNGATEVVENQFTGDREIIQIKAAKYALYLLFKHLKH